MTHTHIWERSPGLDCGKALLNGSGFNGSRFNGSKFNGSGFNGSEVREVPTVNRL